MIAGLLLCLFMTYKIYQTQLRYETEYIPKLQEVEKRLNEQDLRKQNLERYQLYMDTRQYIEDIAREKLGLIYPDEIILRRADD